MSRAPASIPATLAAVVSAYLNWHSLRGSSHRHQGDLRRMLTCFTTAVGDDRPLKDVAREDCESFLAGFQARGCKPNTLKAYHRVLDAFFKWAVNDERLDVSPMKRVPKPKLIHEEIRPLTPEELGQLLSQPDATTFTGQRDRALIALLGDTGLRISEALAIRIEEVDRRGRCISVLGKGGKRRRVFYGEGVEALLKIYLARRDDLAPRDLLFVSSLNEPLARFSVGRRIKAYGEAAGVAGKRVSPHTLRHSFAVAWLMGGGDAMSLQRLLGHTTPTMTSRYVSFTAGDLAKLHQANSPIDRLCESQPELRRTLTPKAARKRLR